jgi:hypothetical protein
LREAAARDGVVTADAKLIAQIEAIAGMSGH